MSGMTNTMENSLLLLLLNATTFANVATNATVSPLASFYVSLHIGDPGEAGDQTTNEISYTGYARIAVARTAGGWTVTNNVASPVAAITFNAMTAGAGGTVTHFGIGTDVSGAGRLLLKGTVSPNIAVTAGVTPQLDTNTTITFD